MVIYAPRFMGGPVQITPSSSPYGTTIQSQGNVLNPARVTDCLNMGVFWMRFFVNWSTIEATPGVYTWTLVDDAVGKCNTAGISYDFCIVGPPAWHCYGTNPNPGFLCDSKAWAVPADAAAFASIAAHRYTVGDPTNPAALHIEALESANEGYDDGASQCHSGKWAVPMQQAIYRAVKAINPGIRIGAPAQLQLPKGAALAWIQDYYTAGGGGFCDYHQIHFYPGARGPFTDDGVHVTLQQYAHQIKATANPLGFHPQVWVTETGYAQNNLTGTDTGPCAGAGGGVGGYPEQSCLQQQTLDAGRLSNGDIDKVFLYTIAGSDGYSPVSGSSPEIFHEGYAMYQAYTAQYPVWTGGAAPPALSVDRSTLAFAAISGGAPANSQNITLTDTSGTGTAWTSAVLYAQLPPYVERSFASTLVEHPLIGANWLTLTPASGTLAGLGSVVVAFTANTGVLPAGTYSAVVTFTAVSGGATATVAVSFIVSPASSALLTLYATNVPSLLLTSAGTLATALGGTEVGVTSKVGSSLGYGELTALGTVASWPALPALPAPSGLGWLLPTGILDNQSMVAGTWTCVGTFKFGGTSGSAFVTDLYVRVSLYDTNFSTYTTLALFTLTGQNLGSNNKVVLSFPNITKIQQAFGQGQTIYIDVLPNISASGLGSTANAFVYESSVAGAGLSAELALGFPGFAPSIPPLPSTNTYAVLIGNTPVTVESTTLTVKSTIGKRGEATMTVFDPLGTAFLQQWQRLSVYDKLQTLVFSGYITSPQRSKPGFQPLLETALTATDQHYLADKRIVATYYLGQTWGFIVRDLVNTILSQEGVTIGMIVDGGTPIPQVTFSYCTVAAALDALATQASSSGTPYYWMIDQFKRLFFVPYTAITGPVIDGTTVDDGKLSGLVPSVTPANPSYRNTQYVAGGNAATSSVTETRKGDSNTRSWTMGYPLAQEPAITVNGTTQQVGIKGSSGFDFYWAAGDPVVTQSPGNPVLTSSDTLSVTYVGQYPSVFTGKNSAQIAEQAALDGTSGMNESVLNDNTVASVQDGLARVGQQLNVYGVRALTFVFATLTPGYLASQLCTVNYPPLGLNNLSMLIEEVTATDQKDGYNLWYTVKCIQGPYDTNWQQFFGNILQQGQPNDINVGQSGGSQIPTPNFTMSVATAFTFTATVGTAWYPSNQIFPSNTLFPSSG